MEVRDHGVDALKLVARHNEQVGFARERVNGAVSRCTLESAYRCRAYGNNPPTGRARIANRLAAPLADFDALAVQAILLDVLVT